MAAGLLIFPGAQPSRSRQGAVISAELRWYLNETTTPATVYTDAAMTVPHPFPIVSDDAGRFSLIYADQADSFSCTWSTAAPDSQVQSFDYITPSTAEDVVLLDEMNAVLDDAMDLYDSIEAVNEAVLLAEDYAAQAAAAVTGIPGTNATSTTSLTIGSGSKSLTVETGKVLVPGMTVTIASTASALNAMSGQVTAYNPSTGSLTVESITYRGSGTYAAWTISLSALNQTNLITREARTSNTPLALADQGKYIDITSGTFTQDLGAAGTLGTGWWLDYGNSGTGIATIDPSGTETIGGQTTLTIPQGVIYRIISDGISGFNLIQLAKTDAWDFYAYETTPPTYVPTVWTKRPMAAAAVNNLGITLSAGVLTNVPPGRYRVTGVAGSQGTTASVTRVRNTTTGTTLAVGRTVYAGDLGSGYYLWADSTIDEVITIAATSSLELQFLANSTGTGPNPSLSPGTVSGSGELTKFSEIRLKRLNP